MSLFRTKKTKVMLIIFGLFIQQPTNPGSYWSQTLLSERTGRSVITGTLSI
jgi:hypothetical protein